MIRCKYEQTTAIGAIVNVRLLEFAQIPIWYFSVSAAAAGSGSLVFLIQTKIKGYIWNNRTYTNAIKRGNLSMLKWILEICPCDRSNLFLAALKENRYDIYKYLAGRSFTTQELMFKHLVESANIYCILHYAVHDGNIELIKYIIQYAICELPLSSILFHGLTRNRELLQFVENVDLSNNTRLYSIFNKCSIESVEWILKRGFVVLQIDWQCIFMYGRIDILKYLKARGVVCETKYFQLSTIHGHFSTVKWAFENNYTNDLSLSIQKILGIASWQIAIYMSRDNVYYRHLRGNYSKRGRDILQPYYEKSKYYAGEPLPYHWEATDNYLKIIEYLSTRV